ncbi:MAG: hypothetical protein Q9184_005194 [Pyrenodesmia sp. 2 TL-2023]
MADIFKKGTAKQLLPWPGLTFKIDDEERGGERGEIPDFLPDSSARETRDIYVDDLDATLEAHRATNTAKIIRRVSAPTDPTVKHLYPSVFNDHEVHAEAHVAGESSQAVKDERVKVKLVKGIPSKEDSKALRAWEYWPVGTIQYQRLVKPPQKKIRGSVQEYHARAMIPIDIWRRPSHGDENTDGLRPWLENVNETGGEASQRLASEIRSFEQYMTPSIPELNAVKKVTAQAKHVIESTVTDSSVQVKGSHSTGLAMPWSDIDLAILLPAVQEEAAAHRKSPTGLKYQKLYLKTLRKLRRSFAKDPEFSVNEESLVIHARVPIVRVVHRRTGLEVQIQIQTGFAQQQQYTLAYLAEFPTLRPLYFVLRSSLHIRRLNTTHAGGLGSYALLIMIVNALKHASGRYDRHDVAKHLLHVLRFYARSDLYVNGFSVDPLRTFHKGKVPMTSEDCLQRATDPVLRGIGAIASPNLRQPYLLCLQDPADASNDLGSNAYAIKHIQATFGRARWTMIGAMAAWNRRSSNSLEGGKQLGLLDPLVCAYYEHFNWNRDKVKEFGASEYHECDVKPIGGTRPRRNLGSGEGKMSTREMLEKVMEIDERKAAKRGGQESRDLASMSTV